MLFHLNLPSNIGSKVFKIDFSIILIRGEVKVNGQVFVGSYFFEVDMHRILG